MAIDFKALLTSKTVIGAAVAIVAGALGVIFKLNADDAAAVKVSVEDALTSLGVVLGGAFAIYGRIKAKDNIATGAAIPPSTN